MKFNRKNYAMHLKKKEAESFEQEAKEAKMSVKDYAEHVLMDSDSSLKQKKNAQLFRKGK